MTIKRIENLEVAIARAEHLLLVLKRMKDDPQGHHTNIPSTDPEKILFGRWQAVVGDFHRHLGLLANGTRRLFAFLGGTIGNLDPDERAVFLGELGAAMAHGDRLLLGTDLVKNRARLVSAYDDSAGVTAEFNRNVLHVLNRELAADFDPERFRHVARWNEPDQRIEMWLRSLDDRRVRVADLDLDLEFGAGEELLTEISTKFSPDALEAELTGSGFEVEAMWPSEGDEFLVTMARRP